MRGWWLSGLGLTLLAAGLLAGVPAPEIPPDAEVGSPAGSGLPDGGAPGLLVGTVLLLGLGAYFLTDPSEAAGSRRLAPGRRLGPQGLVGIGMWVLAAVVTSAGMSRFVGHLTASRFTLVAGGSASLQAVFLLAGLMLWWRAPGTLPRFWRGGHRRLRSCVSWGILGYLRVYPLILVAVLANLFLLRFAGLDDGTPRALEFLAAATTPAQRVVVLLLVLVGAPLAEELFFRGLVHRAVSEWMARETAAVVSGGIFALVHFDLMVLVPLWVLGWVLARWYDRSRSMLTVVTMHACQNGLSLVLFWVMLPG